MQTYSHWKNVTYICNLVRKSETSMVDPARHTGLPERTLGELSETSLGKKYLIQTRTIARASASGDGQTDGRNAPSCSLARLPLASSQPPPSLSPVRIRIVRSPDRRQKERSLSMPKVREGEKLQHTLARCRHISLSVRQETSQTNSQTSHLHRRIR